MKRVLFVCIGNCCRSQMAEGFANFYGKDVLNAKSSGLSPTPIVAQETIDTMAEKNVDISRHYPKKFNPLEANDFDLIINMSGFVLPGKVSTPERKWEVLDPYGDSMDVYRAVSNDLEMRVMQLILEFRRLANNK
jgi:arsenate reductase (thioredoxin)